MTKFEKNVMTDSTFEHARKSTHKRTSLVVYNKSNNASWPPLVISCVHVYNLTIPLCINNIATQNTMCNKN